MAASGTRLEALMGHSLAGDARAHEEMLRLLAPALRSYFGRRMSRAQDDVDDLVQEALIAIHTRRSSYDPSRPIFPWVYAIAKYKLIDYFRRTKNASAEELHENDAAEEFESACAARIDVETMLGALPEKQRLAIRATQIDGESGADVSARHGWSPSDVKVSVHRGLKTLAVRFGGAQS